MFQSCEVNFNKVQAKVRSGNTEEAMSMICQLDMVQRSALLNEADEEGDTLLHIAVQVGNYRLVSHLLGLDTRMDRKNKAELTPLDIATNNLDKKIATLLKTRMDWAERNTSGIALNRALDLIQGSYHAIELGRGMDLVLILGETGVGKSTLINYLNGAVYEEIGIRGFDFRTKCVSGKEIAQVGHNPMVSETLYPQVLSISSKVGIVNVADLAGINGTRESVVELAGTLSTHLLSKMASAIKSILFVIDINSLNASRGGVFRQTIKTLNKILQGNFKGSASACVHFVLTKVPPGVTVEQVMSHYIRRLHDQLENQIQIDGLSDDDRAMYHTIELMLQSPEKIFIPNVFDNGDDKVDPRLPILSALKNSHVISKDNLDFLHMDRHQEAFLSLLTFIGGEYVHRSQEINQVLPLRVKQLEDTIRSDNLAIKNWELDISEANKIQEEGMTPEKARQMMIEKQATLRLLEANLREKTQEQITIKLRLESDNKLINELDLDIPIEYGNAYRFQHSGQLEVIGGKDPGLIKKIFGAKSKAPEVRKKRGTGNHVFENRSSPSPGKVVDLDCNGQGGNFGERHLQNNIFSQHFAYPLGENAFAEIRVKLAKRDIPVNKVRIDQSKDNILRNSKRLEEVENEIKSCLAEQDTIQSEINQLQGEGIDAAATIESLKSQIRQRQEWIENKQATILTATRETNAVLNRITQLSLEVSVNQDVFETLYQIVKTLELDKSEEEVIKQFFEMYSENLNSPKLRSNYSPVLFKKVTATECVLESTVSVEKSCHV